MSWIQGKPDAVALLTPQGEITYSELEARIAMCKEGLALSGFEPGHRAALVMPLSTRYVVILLALLRHGVRVCPVNTRLPDKGIQHAIEAVGADVVFHENHAEGLPGSGISPLNYEAIQRTNVDVSMDDEPRGELHPMAPQHQSLAVFTSGSSGNPKAAVLSMAQMLSSADALQKCIPLTQGDVWLLSLPLYHVAGLSILFRCLHAGAAAALADFSSDLAESIQDTKATHVSLVSTQLYRLLNSSGGAETLTECKAVMMGGSAVPAKLIEKAHTAGIRLHTSYGMTETSAAITCTNPGANLQDLLTSGSPIHPGSVRIAEDGCIQVSGPSLFQGYLERGTLHSDTIRDDWLTTNDLGRIDAAGRLHIIGRADNMFISGGENIQPEEIESCLCQLDTVIQAVVVPEEDPEFGQRPIAYVQSDSEVDASAIQSQLREVLPGFKIPVRVMPWPEDAPDVSIKACRGWLKARHS